MKNLVSGKEIFEGKKMSSVYEYYSHYSMPKIRHNKRRPVYKGIINPEPKKSTDLAVIFQH